MKNVWFGCLAAVLMIPGMAQGQLPAASADRAVPDGFVSLFDGKTLDGWDGDPRFWSVQDGCITGISTEKDPVKYNTFLIWKDDVQDFELQIDFCLYNGNSGIQYRAWPDEGKPWKLAGYQADIADPQYMGFIYGEKFRGILAQRGQKTKIGKDHKPVLVEQFADSDALLKQMRPNGWNTYRVVVQGNVCTNYMNGVKIAEIVDEDDDARFRGKLGLQMHVGPPMKVQFKNVFLKTLPKSDKK